MSRRMHVTWNPVKGSSVPKLTVRVGCRYCAGSGKVDYYGQLQGSLEFGHAEHECGTCQGVGTVLS